MTITFRPCRHWSKHPKLFQNLLRSMLALILICVFVLCFALISLVSGRITLAQMLGRFEGVDLLRIDERRPVVYLRPFDFDEWSTRSRSVKVEVSGFSMMNGDYSAPSYEQSLAKVLDQIGPCIAITHPKSNKHIKGFSRMRLRNLEWQRQVEVLMKRAALVILCAGTDEGIVWEFAKACEVVPRERLVILIISSTSEKWWQMAERMLQTRLPRIGSYEQDPISGMLYFDKNGKPNCDSIVPVEGNLRKTMTDAFRPVFNQLRELNNHMPPDV